MFRECETTNKMNPTTPKYRENTFKIHLEYLPRRPSFEDIHEFIFKQLKLPLEHVVRLQASIVNQCFYVKTIDKETAMRVVSENNMTHEVEFEGKKHKIPLSMEDNTTDVKVHDLSENISSEQLKQHFNQNYGEVISIEKQKWGHNFVFKDIDCGVIVVKMNLTQHIKSYITINGESTFISYFGQIQTCKHCGNKQHNGMSCSQNKNLLAQKNDISGQNSGAPDYSSVLKKSRAIIVKTNPVTEPQNTDILENNPENILENTLENDDQTNYDNVYIQNSNTPISQNVITQKSSDTEAMEESSGETETNRPVTRGRSRQKKEENKAEANPKTKKIRLNNGSVDQ